MSEDSSRRKSNNPSRVLQSIEEIDVLDIPDDENIEIIDSKRWFHSQDELVLGNDTTAPDGGGVYEVRSIEDLEQGANEVDLGSRADYQGVEQQGASTGRLPTQSILCGSHFSLNSRRHLGSSFSRHRQAMDIPLDSEQGYSLELESNQVRRQQRAVEPFVCRTTSTTGKKDASMQFPDDELSVLREENESLRKENTELRKKVDRLVDTIALNDALPSLLASLRGEQPLEMHAAQSSSTQSSSYPSMSSSPPSILTISKCQSLAVDEPVASTSASVLSSAAQDVKIPASESGVAILPQDVARSNSTPAISQLSIVDRMSMPQTSMAQVVQAHVAGVDQLQSVQHVTQTQMQIPRAPVVPVLAPSIQMSLPNQTPMVPPGAPSQLAMMQHSIVSQVLQAPSQGVMPQMEGSSPVPMRMRGKTTGKQSGKQAEESVEISLSNRVKVDKKLLDRCNHTNFRKLTSDLLMCLFSRKVLSRSTLGGTSHSISRTTGLPTNKTRLDPVKVEAIIDYVQRVTGVPIRAVKDAIRTKLNNEAKRMHRQIIFKRSVHYPPGSSEDPT